MEFHAFILCGPGKGLSPFSQQRSSGQPKALLPVANRPMIEGVLDWCEMAFFPKVTLIVNDDSEHQISLELDEYKRKLAAANKAKQTADESSPYTTDFSILNLETDFSGYVLYHLYKSGIHPYHNFVVLPCDFVTNLPPQVFIEAYRNKSDKDVGLLVHYRNTLDIEDKKTKIFPTNYTFYGESKDDDSTKLLDIYSAEDVEFHKTLKIRTQMTWRYPNTIISKKLLNSGIFFGSGDIFTIFAANPNRYTEAYFLCRPLTKIIRDLARRSWRHSKLQETIAFLIIPDIATFYRINNTPVLMEANRSVLQQQAIQKSQSGVLPAAREKNAANVGIDSLIGDNSVLGERTNVKMTVIGKNCKIGKRVRLTGSLVMDNVVIDDDVSLENCIVGSDVIIHSKSKLTNCNVEAMHEVVNGSHFKGETLLSLSLEGIVENGMETATSEEDSSGSDDESDDYDDDVEYDDNADGLFDY
ncbi:Translation initiation factor eIF-2B subunit gamma [Yamadazyma tenuis]|uniref:Translation initiation factor eIF2B subunit gamma n=1 Tax=Candida tenuis (strain ATCC 10573 / BCRC 21748 / CBS 615 / JCM 9827 / NBRC 10315 / NRRL Y-1498 / VKM Y-70) TaxID=590646 RepID=G3B3M7_CANTC|nr:translation initiation factor eIF2B subunit [Yamadazyma tenuis ATCC 10573]XP_006686738.1 uncharacterized protein CANTEDRAFT_114257 [Yamadazyma tenuis ATCC 10573]EGV64423.1 translation initiation factor eIF2B subunit [Yamadazyma tenuis ATCC 10573]EGV64424.1 hypothetical protein CANTEDRAFT_114257 [Yamadazyma tenuis ATCC 10573]WEJ96149.1 Translation initiation factor eIF-2B subunit gamma [Yamadazyma tenuis]